MTASGLAIDRIADEQSVRAVAQGYKSFTRLPLQQRNPRITEHARSRAERQKRHASAQQRSQRRMRRHAQRVNCKEIPSHRSQNGERRGRQREQQLDERICERELA